MPPKILQQIELLQGADTRFDFPILIDREPPPDGLDGWTFAFRLFTDREDPDDKALVTLTSAGGSIWVFDNDAAIARLRVTQEDIAALTPGQKYFWRFTSLAPNGDDDVPAHGFALVNR